MKGVTEGRMVHYVLDSGPNLGSHRPAVIVNAGTEGVVNLQVFTDGSEDELPGQPWSNLSWKSYVPYSAEKTYGTWHWIEPA